MIQELKEVTGRGSANTGRALEVLNKLSRQRPTIEEIKACNAQIIINDLRKHDHVEISSEARRVRMIWKRHLEGEEDVDIPAPSSAPPTIMGKKPFGALKGSVPFQAQAVARAPAPTVESGLPEVSVDTLKVTVKSISTPKEAFDASRLPQEVTADVIRRRASRLLFEALPSHAVVTGNGRFRRCQSYFD